MVANNECTVQNDLMVLGIPILDMQHANLVRIVGNLRLACQNGIETSNVRFIYAVHEAVDYAKYHFSTEEKLLALLEYPDHHQHKREHWDFIWEILNLAKQFEEGQGLSPEKFVDFFGKWLNSHIALSDKVFADYFLTMKHHAKLKLILCGKQQLTASYA